MTHYFIMPFLLGNRKQYDEADAVLKYHSSQRLDLRALLTGIATGCGCKVKQMRQETNHTPLSGAVWWCCGGAKTWGLKLNVQTPHPTPHTHFACSKATIWSKGGNVGDRKAIILRLIDPY